MRFLAARYNAKGNALDDEGDLEGAIAAYRCAIRWDREWSVPWYNLGLIYKRLGNWRESLLHNQEAVARNADDEAAWWNLGIAATALGEWREARRAWRGCRIDVPDGDGPVEFHVGATPIRLNPDGEATEVVWCERIDPARAIIRSVPLPESGHRCGDLLLHDGAPNGSRIHNGREVSVFDELAVLQPSPLGTFIVTLSGLDESAAAALVEQATGPDIEAEDWSSNIHYLCKTCCESKIGDQQSCPHEPPDADLPRRLGFAASSERAVRDLVETFLAAHDGATIVSIECALPPLPVQ